MKYKEIPYTFKNIDLLEQAFIHRSYINEHRQENLVSNERLEFLGDAVLELVVSLFIYNKYPRKSEGQLTTIRAKLVQTTTLSLASLRLGFDQEIKLSRGEKASGGNRNPSLLADTFEAVVGAIYQDGGFTAAFNFVETALLIPAASQFANQIPNDYKSTLQEVIQGKNLPTPKYKIIKEYGPDHNKTFIVGVYINEVKKAEGKGKSKQQAEQAAAKVAIDILGLKK